MPAENDNHPTSGRAVQMAEIIHKIRDKEPVTDEARLQLENWINANEANRKLFDAMLQRDQVTDEVQALTKYDSEKAASRIFDALGVPAPMVIPLWRKVARRGLAAAALLLLLAGGVWYFVNKSAVVNTLTVPRGAQSHIVLADGSEAWLNAESSITYPASFDGKTRDIAITGEVYFKVTKDAQRPFQVTAGKTIIEVLGTEFDVMAYDGEDTVRASLVNGSISVQGQTQQKPQQQVVLKPGEQASFSQLTGLLQVTKANLDEVLGWRAGEFRWNDAGIPTIMRQVARWYDVTVEYRGSVEGFSFTGQLSRKHRLVEVLNLLSETRKVHFEMPTPKTIVVIPGQKK